MDGYLVYANPADEINAVRFEVDGLKVVSPPNPLPGGGEKTTEVALRASASSVVYVPNVLRLRPSK